MELVESQHQPRLPRGLDEMAKEPSSVSLPRADWASPAWAWGLDLEGIKVSVPGRQELSVPRLLAVCPGHNALGIHCVHVG